MHICVIGTGYVGLVTATCFACVGNHVVCVDKDADKIARLKDGIIPIYEPGLEALVKSNEAEGRLTYTTDLSQGINQADICFIAVGTPPNEDGSADLSHVLSVAAEMAQVATKKIIVGTKSTVPVGTGDKIEAIFTQNLKHPFVVFSNPEFLKEGDAINDFMKPDRIIIGLDNDSIESQLQELYAPFTRKKERILFMSRKSAELTKYAANAMLATRISFMNEMANLCEKVGANINDIRSGIGSDYRIGSEFLFPGIGYGGSCFPKDVQAILNTAKEYHSTLSVIEATDQANQRQKEILFDKIVAHYGSVQALKDKTFAIWGLAFKAKTDDIRESPALVLIDKLLKAQCMLNVFDPQAIQNVEALYGSKLNYFQHSYDCLARAEALIIATEWNEFRSPDFDKMKALMKNSLIFDGRNILIQNQVKEHGFVYYGIGMN